MVLTAEATNMLKALLSNLTTQRDCFLALNGLTLDKYCYMSSGMKEIESQIDELVRLINEREEVA